MPRRLILLWAVFLLTSPIAQAAPSLADQSAWSEGDKKEFLEYLNTGHGAPIGGQVKEIAPPEARETTHAKKPLFITFEVSSGVAITSVGGNAADQSVTLGPRLLVGGHLFSWVRYFFGFEYHSLSEPRTDGTRSGVDVFTIPVGVELALIPLGAPHTQYFILRAGLGTHLFNSGTPASSFTNPLLGFQETWNLGLGYEWQIKETHLRVHVLADTQFAFSFQSTRFDSVGFGAGITYMF